jgi:hypothetical protein
MYQRDERRCKLLNLLINKETEQIMKNRNIILIILLFLTNLSKCAEPNLTIEIVPLTKEISVGQPFLFQVVCKLDQPLISSSTNKISEIYHLTPYIVIDHEEANFSLERDKLFPEELYLRQGQEAEYYQNYSLFYCYVAEEKFRLMFPVPGKYTIKVRGRTKSSVPLVLDVKHASKLEEKALSILTGGTDLAILGSVESDTLKDYPEVMDRFQQVVEQCPDTMLAKMAAARLGIEEIKEFQEKHTGDANMYEKYRKDPMFETAYKHLNMAYQLPEVVTIRENALYNLVTIEIINGNAEKSLSLIDELAAKYPLGKYGKRAVRDKNDVQDFIKRRPDLFVTEPNQPETNNLLGFALPATAIGVVVILAIGGIFLYKKKAKSITK